MNNFASVSGVCERDIDLLVLEEAVASPGFRRLLLEAVGWEVDLRFVDARRSVTQSNGESDLEITFENHVGRRRLLIENKVSAGFQPNQANRYLERGINYCSQRLCVSCVALLLAPRRYVGSKDEKKGFNAFLSYEALIGWYEAADIGDRSLFKISMLQAAIDRAVLGYQPQADATVTNFWRDYWLLAKHQAPELQMKKPGGKPGRSGFIRFSPAGLPLRTNLVHKCNHGFVDLQLRGLGGFEHAVNEIMSSSLESDMELARAGKSLAVRILVPKLSTAKELGTQFDEAVCGLRAAVRLLTWAKNVPPPVWRQCNSLL